MSELKAKSDEQTRQLNDINVQKSRLTTENGMCCSWCYSWEIKMWCFQEKVSDD